MWRCVCESVVCEGVCGGFVWRCVCKGVCVRALVYEGVCVEGVCEGMCVCVRVCVCSVS